ncbi:MAG TPA: hypothetical protein VK658_22695 [Chryseolinea sp.]|nr:hypothetical protein [Chryseolinea sp.]
MSHVKLNSRIQQTPAQQRITDRNLEKFSDAVTLILQGEAAIKLKKLVYVFIRVDQLGPTSFTYEVDDSRDKISDASVKLIKSKFEEIFVRPASS